MSWRELATLIICVGFRKNDGSDLEGLLLGGQSEEGQEQKSKLRPSYRHFPPYEIFLCSEVSDGYYIFYL